MGVNVYIETNFILNLALRQEESIYSNRIVKLAAIGEICLILPSYCVMESYEALIKRHASRVNLAKNINKTLGDMGRSSFNRKIYETHKSLLTEIPSSISAEITKLDKILKKLLAISVLIPINPRTHKDGVLYRKRLNIRHEPDAFVLGSIKHDIETNRQRGRKIFVTTDSKFIQEPKVRRLLANLRCNYFDSPKKTYEAIV